jgi:hypothetical protein
MKAPLRRYYISRYGDLYKRAKNIPLDVCVYCGDTRQTFDHCPPISKLEYIDVPKAIKKGLKFILYPSCNECNSYLGAKMSVDLLERMGILAEIYMKKADKCEIWTTDELDELGHNLKSMIVASSNRALHFADKAKKVLDRADDLAGISSGE